jgi:ABC-type sugar transport system ATPase subunit
MTLGSRVVVMKDGWVQQVGEPLEIYGRPANKFVAGFIGSPAMNFIPTAISEVNGTMYAEAAGLRIKVPAAALVLFLGVFTIGSAPKRPSRSSDRRTHHHASTR